jgi:hypothetical protein
MNNSLKNNFSRQMTSLRKLWIQLSAALMPDPKLAAQGPIVAVTGQTAPRGVQCIRQGLQQANTISAPERTCDGSGLFPVSVGYQSAAPAGQNWNRIYLTSSYRHLNPYGRRPDGFRKGRRVICPCFFPDICGVRDLASAIRPYPIQSAARDNRNVSWLLNGKQIQYRNPWGLQP